MNKVQKRRQIALMGLSIWQICENEKKKNRIKWMKTWIQEKKIYGHMPLIRELRTNEQDDLKNYLRMPGHVFDELLRLVSPHIMKKDTVMRLSISPEERLVATLRYLATGQSYESLKFSTGIAAQTLGHIIPDTCRALCKVLQNYLKVPESTKEWNDIALGFKTRWQMINCGGAIDGKHIRISPPPGSGALYYNYKKFYSVVLMAVVNHNYEFIYVDVGKQGRISDGGVFDSTSFCHRLKNGALNLPSADETEEKLNFVFIADDAFPLHDHILKPFPQKNLTNNKRIYNYRISRARNVVENTFGLIATVFRILHTTINIAPDKIKYVILAICYLHNYLRQSSPSYASSTEVDRPDKESLQANIIPELNYCTMPSLQDKSIKNQSCTAKENRLKYMEYFNNKGKVSWQDEMLTIGRC